MPLAEEGRQVTLDYYYGTNNYYLPIGTMTKPKPEDKIQQETINEFRRKHCKRIMEKLRVRLERIVDEPDSKGKEIVDAAKTLARMMGALAPEKIGDTSKQTLTKKEKELSPAEKAEVDTLLNE